MMKADKLKSNKSESAMSAAPIKFSSEWLTSVLLSRAVCSKKYVTRMIMTPVVPTKSYHSRVV